MWSLLEKKRPTTPQQAHKGKKGSLDPRSNDKTWVWNCLLCRRATTLIGYLGLFGGI
jgi:hypothetical protein